MQTQTHTYIQVHLHAAPSPHGPPENIQSTSPKKNKELIHPFPSFPFLDDSKNRPDRISLYALSSDPLFYQSSDGNGPLIPTLRLIHRFPSAFRTIQIDRGAIRFVLSGATLMVPGLTSPGGRLPPSSTSTSTTNTTATINAEKEQKEEKEKAEGDGDKGDKGQRGIEVGGVEEEGPMSAGSVAVVMAEGKEEACMVGELKMSTEEMKRVGKGVAIEGGHFLGDGLWNIRIE